jgi:tripartite-type tricarboxylate transporter receptor subunit TctC
MLCHDVTVLSTNPTGRFKSWDEIKAFAADHPKEVKVAGTAPNGIDGMTIRQFVKESGVSLDLVSFDNSSEVNSALLGNHVDMSTDDCVSTVHSSARVTWSASWFSQKAV